MCENCKGPSDTFVKGMATILWASAWADHAEAHNCCNLSGRCVEHYMPEVPEIAWRRAERLAGQIENENGMSIAAIFHHAMQADGRSDISHEDYHGADAERFGECLAYEAMGSGVSWFDDHAAFKLAHAKWPEMIVPDTDAGSELQSYADTKCADESLDGRVPCPSCSAYVKPERATCAECSTKLSWEPTVSLGIYKPSVAP